MPRLVAALLAAAATAPMPLAIVLGASAPEMGVMLLLAITLFGFPVALLHVLLLALPVYLLFRRWWHIDWWNSALAGFVIGGLPAGLASSPWQTLAAASACGVAGGLMFWFVLKPQRIDRADQLRETFA